VLPLTTEPDVVADAADAVVADAAEAVVDPLLAGPVLPTVEPEVTRPVVAVLPDDEAVDEAVDTPLPPDVRLALDPVVEPVVVALFGL